MSHKIALRCASLLMSHRQFMSVKRNMVVEKDILKKRNEKTQLNHHTLRTMAIAIEISIKPLQVFIFAENHLFIYVYRQEPIGPF